MIYVVLTVALLDLAAFAILLAVLSRGDGLHITITHAAPPAVAISVPTVAPGVIHLTPERDAAFAKSKRESEGDF